MGNHTLTNILPMKPSNHSAWLFKLPSPTMVKHGKTMRTHIVSTFGLSQRLANGVGGRNLGAGMDQCQTL